MAEFYKFGTSHENVIINEYDAIINESPYSIQQTKLTGIWALREKKVIAFTATTSLSYERLIHNCISPPLTLRFQSEYELINGVSPVQLPNISTFTEESLMLQSLASDIESLYEKKPIIIIHDRS